MVVDDRSWVAPCANECVEVGLAWRRWSDCLGLKENLAKDQYFQRTARGRRCMSEAGVPDGKVLTDPKVLGIVLVPVLLKHLG